MLGFNGKWAFSNLRSAGFEPPTLHILANDFAIQSTLMHHHNFDINNIYCIKI